MTLRLAQATINASPAQAWIHHLRDIGPVPTFFEPLEGNNGDRLIQMGARHAFHEAAVPLVDCPEDAEHIVLNGGGAMNDIWQGGFDVLRRYAERFPHKPMTVGPSSYLFHETHLIDVLADREATITMFARDRFSFEALQTQITADHLEDIVLAKLADDLAFQLRGSTFVTGLQQQSAAEQVLICLRKDREGSASQLVQSVSGRSLPGWIRRPLSRLRDRLAARDACGPIDALIPHDFRGLPRYVRDVSVSVSFEEFSHAISKSALVVTDRLHVAILAAMLGKSILLRPGLYHKIRGVVELSLSEYNAINWMEAKS